MIVEGVRYRRFVVSYRVGGRRRRMVRWSPGPPWIFDEVGRELWDRFGRELAAESVTITRAP